MFSTEDIQIEKKLISKENYRTNDDYKAEYLRYSNLIKNYNSDIPTLRLLQTKYISLAKVYKLGVEDYNNLAKIAYSRWYLIPVRKSGSKSFSKHIN